MVISITVYAFITFFINLVTTQELAVTYITIHISSYKKYYSYRDNMYATEKQLKEEIIKNHGYVDPKYLLMTKISSFGKGKTLIKEEQKYRNIYTGKFLTPTPQLIIEEFYIRKRLIYKCNRKIFTSYNKALDYVLNEKTNNPLKYTRKPNFPILPPLENINWSKENIYCRKFWMKLWNYCDFYCYSRNNFTVMKEKFLIELSYYRQKFGVNKLVECKNLSTVALNYLKKIIPLNSKVDLRKFENVGISSLGKAPLIINHWFGEHKLYNQNTRFGSPETRHFTAMVWIKANKVGIGIIRQSNKIFVKIVYDRNVIMPSQFEKNALKKVNG
uniref:SCP domain-containing protein n=1 Tax=Strongyloides venezuelensis TaxID=75913 RepID=A0A0K0FIZ1_STRVS